MKELLIKQIIELFSLDITSLADEKRTFYDIAFKYKTELNNNIELSSIEKYAFRLVKIRIEFLTKSIKMLTKNYLKANVKDFNGKIESTNDALFHLYKNNIISLKTTGNYSFLKSDVFLGLHKKKEKIESKKEKQDE